MVALAPNSLRRSILDARARLIMREDAVAEEVTGFLRRLFARWREELAAMAKDAGDPTVAAIERALSRATILRRLKEISDEEIGAVETMVTRRARAAGREEAYRLASIIDQHLSVREETLGVAFGGVNTDAIRAALAGGVPGAGIVDGFKKLRSASLAALGEDVATAIADGWRIDDLTEKWAKGLVRGRLVGYGAARARRDAEAVARTAIMAAANNGHLIVYRNTRAIVSMVRWEATFDVRTCLICGRLHGREFFINEAPSMPAHLRCRCVWLPVFADERLNEAVGRLQAYQRPDGAVVFRESDRSMEAWLRKQTQGVQQDFFRSDVKFNAWRNNRLTLSQMVTDDGRILRDREIQALLRLQSDLPALPAGTQSPRLPLGGGSEPPPAGASAVGAEGPGRKKPSEVLQIADAGRGALPEMRAAAKLADLVHTLPDVQGIPARSYEKLKSLGIYSWERDYARRRIYVQPGTGKERTALLHEFGHFIDHTVFGDGKMMWGSRSGEFTDFLEAASRTNAVRSLYFVASDPTAPPGMREYARYCLQRAEVFARAYAQWIATKSGDKIAMEQILGLVGAVGGKSGPPIQWTPDDFSGIADALDRLFARKGLLP